MSVDVGTVRTGIAVCDKYELLASPLCVINKKTGQELIDEIVSLVNTERIDELVIGNPVRLNGIDSLSTERSKELAAALSQLLDIPVKLWDERVTTVAAQKQLQLTNTRGKKQRSVIDAVAAVLILESYLAYRKNTGLKA